MANQIYASVQNIVVKQLNDLWLSFSFDIHKELYNLTVLRTSGSNTISTNTTASGTQLSFGTALGDKIYQQGKFGHAGLDQVNGESVLLVLRNPVGAYGMNLTVPYTTVGNVSGSVTINVQGTAGKNQATYLGLGASGTQNVIQNIIQVGDGTPSGGISVTGAVTGQSFKFMSMPTTWLPQSFVRSIVPTLPKNYHEVADHYDGSATTISVTTINTLMLSKVYQDVPGSFLMITDRYFTVKAEVQSLDSGVSSETHFFTACRGTGKIAFNKDAESITEAESTMVDWITVTTI